MTLGESRKLILLRLIFNPWYVLIAIDYTLRLSAEWLRLSDLDLFSYRQLLWVEIGHSLATLLSTD